MNKRGANSDGWVSWVSRQEEEVALGESSYKGGAANRLINHKTKVAVRKGVSNAGLVQF